jgi:hypothetical protein
MMYRQCQELVCSTNKDLLACSLLQSSTSICEDVDRNRTG